MAGRLLTMQQAGWANLQLHPYGNGPVMEGNQMPWNMRESSAQDTFLARTPASRRVFSNSMEYTPEVSDCSGAVLV